METSISQQINAIKLARGIMEKLSKEPILSMNIGNFENAVISSADAGLNDALATLAAIKMMVQSLKSSLAFETQSAEVIRILMSEDFKL